MCDNAMKPFVNRVSAVRSYGVDKVCVYEQYCARCAIYLLH